MLRMTMGNRLAVPQANGCCTTMDTSESAAPDDSTEPEPAMPPPRGSFEIMNQFTWDMVHTRRDVFDTVVRV